MPRNPRVYGPKARVEPVREKIRFSHVAEPVISRVAPLFPGETPHMTRRLCSPVGKGNSAGNANFGGRQCSPGNRVGAPLHKRLFGRNAKGQPQATVPGTTVPCDKAILPQKKIGVFFLVAPCTFPGFPSPKGRANTKGPQRGFWEPTTPDSWEPPLGPFFRLVNRHPGPGLPRKRPLDRQSLGMFPGPFWGSGRIGKLEPW